MKVQGEGFKFFIDGESKTVEETKSLIHDNMTITIKGLDVFYYSPKKETKRKQKLELEDLRNYLLNDNSTPKEATDIVYLITAESEEELCQRFSETKLKNYAKEETKTERLLKEAEEHQKQNGGVLQGVEFPFDSTKQNHFLNIPFGNNGTGGVKVFFNKEMENAKKETDGKLFYELDFNFIKQMAERMQSNKDNSKYDLWNWKRPMTPKGVEELKQATLRHLIEILEGNYEDDGRKFGHLEAVSNNIMMINYQLNNE